MTIKLVVGFRMRPAGEPAALIESYCGPLVANRTLTDERKIAADLQAKQAALLNKLPYAPYTGTFDDVFISDRVAKKVGQWSYADRGPGGKKPRICVAAAKWILERYPKAWDDDPEDLVARTVKALDPSFWSQNVIDEIHDILVKGGVITSTVPVAEAKRYKEATEKHAAILANGLDRPAKVIFVGFNMRLFLKTLGVECSLPQVGMPLPPRMWITNTDHRDVAELIAPRDDDYKHLDLRKVILSRRPLDVESAKKFDERMDRWQGPGQDPENDVWIATEMLSQIGFLQTN